MDAQGRLWATTAAYTDQGDGGVYLIAAPGATPVKVLSALKTPLGLLWSGDTLLVASAGRIDAYRGLEGTRFTRRQTVASWSTDFGETNNLVQAPDGRLLVGISAPCDHCTPASNLSGAIVSLHPDGSELHVFATGIRAPFGLAYYPGTSDLFVTMDQRDDLGERTPGDWLSLVREGQDWRAPDCYGQGGSACQGAPSPTAVLDPHGAVGGVAVVTGQLGPRVGTAALVAEWGLGKVQRVGLSRDGSGYRATVGPLLAGLQGPLPVLATGDGAVLVGDWRSGTIYRVI